MALQGARNLIRPGTGKEYQDQVGLLGINDEPGLGKIGFAIIDIVTHNFSQITMFRQCFGKLIDRRPV